MSQDLENMLRLRFQAILPEESDWPVDYDLADARYSTISWSISDEISSEGDAKADIRRAFVKTSGVKLGAAALLRIQQSLFNIESNRSNMI